MIGFPVIVIFRSSSGARYLEFLSTITDPQAGRNKLDKLSHTIQQDDRSCPGFNQFDSDDTLFRAIVFGSMASSRK